MLTESVLRDKLAGLAAECERQAAQLMRHTGESTVPREGVAAAASVMLQAAKSLLVASQGVTP